MNTAITKEMASSRAEIFREVTALLASGVEEGVYPGAVLILGKNGEELYRGAVGFKSLRTNKSEEVLPMTADTVFDIASLTSVVGTTTLVMRLVHSGRLKLEDKVVRYLDGFSVFGKSGISIAHLLTHTSGLAHWVPFYEELVRENSSSRMGILTSRGARDYVVNYIVRSQLKFAPGQKQMYSDLGLILLGRLCEVLTGLSLDKAVMQYVLQPLGMKNTSYVDLSMIKRRGIHPVKGLIAPTEDCPWRKRVLWGEVHDDNAWAMGGIAGHSGLFSTAPDLHLFAAQMLAASRGQSEFLPAEIIRGFWQAVERGEDTSWQCGWDTPSSENGMIESKLNPAAVGVCGFTGCSLWIEPESGIDIVLLTNRIHPSRSNKKIRTFRPQLHDAALEALSRCR